MGCLATTHSKSIHKIDVPTLDWPIAPFPRLTYPLKDYVSKNNAEVKRCLQAVDQIFEVWSKKSPIAALIIEPIQGEGGDRLAPPAFLKGLRHLSRKHGAAMIIDEVQTGGLSSGKFWCHDHADMDDKPDIVTFAKKLQISGYYFSSEFAPTNSFQIFNTWMGDPIRLLQCEVVLKTIKKERLQAKVRKAGRTFISGLEDLSRALPKKVLAPRGYGILAAFDAPDAATRDHYAKEFRNAGVNIMGCGENTFRFRPSLIFTKDHATEALDVFRRVLSKR
jgi:4-aminobutyrate aminotransferase/(S)-3-amino-2-methylpropionate transaminase